MRKRIAGLALVLALLASPALAYLDCITVITVFSQTDEVSCSQECKQYNDTTGAYEGWWKIPC